MVKTVRSATHAGSWYSDKAEMLERDLKGFLQDAEQQDDDAVMIKAIVCPHAGYTYCGRTAAYSWKYLSVFRRSVIKRVVILAPSHFISFKGFAFPFSHCQSYETPFGSLELDVEEIERLKTILKAPSLTVEEDQQEHSVEMMLPFLHILYTLYDDDKEKKMPPPKLIPILVGTAIDSSCLLPLFNDPSCLFVISSDFCHWGKRFGYYYLPNSVTKLKTMSDVNDQIKHLDMEAIKAICEHNITAFEDHVSSTHNTICGVNPIRVLLQLVNASDIRLETSILHYSQSTPIRDQHKDTCVSYAALASYWRT